MKSNNILKLSSLSLIAVGSLVGLALTTTSCGKNDYKTIDEYLKSHAIKLPNPRDFSALEPNDPEITNFVSSNWSNQLLFNSVVFSVAYPTLEFSTFATIKENKIADNFIEIDFTEIESGVTTHIIYQLTPAGIIATTFDKSTPTEVSVIMLSITDGKLSYQSRTTQIYNVVSGTAIEDGYHSDPILQNLWYVDAHFNSIKVVDQTNSEETAYLYFPISTYDWTNVVFPTFST